MRKVAFCLRSSREGDLGTVGRTAVFRNAEVAAFPGTEAQLLCSEHLVNAKCLVDINYDAVVSLRVGICMSPFYKSEKRICVWLVTCSKSSSVLLKCSATK